MKKRAFVILLNICLIFTFFPISAFAASNTNLEKTETGSVSISKYTADVYRRNVQALVNYIMKNGETYTGSIGILKRIESTYSLNGVTLRSIIIYSNNENQLIFSSECETEEIKISHRFDYDIDLCKSISCISAFCMLKKVVPLPLMWFSAEADFDSTKYSKSTILDFKNSDGDMGELFNTYPEECKKLCNSSVLSSMKGWQLLLTQKINMKLEDIGFKNYANGETNPNLPDEPNFPIIPDQPNIPSNKKVDALIQYIIRGGETEDGHKYIEYPIPSSVGDVVRITYREDKNQLVFKYSYSNDTAGSILNLYYDIQSSNTQCLVVYGFKTFFPNNQTRMFVCEANFNIASYNGKSNLTFKKVDNPDPNWAFPSNYNSLCNTGLDVAAAAWNLFLMSEIGITLNEIGFTNYPIDQDEPTPDTPSIPSAPKDLPLSITSGSLGKKVTAQVTGGHWLTVQTKRGTSIAISSIQAPGSGTVSLAFSAATGSTIQVWETEAEMTFNTQGVPNNKILATASRTL